MKVIIGGKIVYERIVKVETINAVELRDETIYPDETVLKKVLGKSYAAYLQLLELFSSNGMTYEWRYYRDGKAWLCKVQKKKKTIVWMSAWKGFMKATIYFPEKYMGRVLSTAISEESKRKIESTKKVGKSTPCIFEIRNKKILKDFTAIMNLKIEVLVK